MKKERWTWKWWKMGFLLFACNKIHEREMSSTNLWPCPFVGFQAPPRQLLELTNSIYSPNAFQRNSIGTQQIFFGKSARCRHWILFIFSKRSIFGNLGNFHSKTLTSSTWRNYLTSKITLTFLEVSLLSGFDIALRVTSFLWKRPRSFRKKEINGRVTGTLTVY